MKRSIAALSVLMILVLPGVSRVASGKEGKSFMWKVRSATGTVYLLGSVHLMKKSIYPLDNEIENAFRTSDVLVVEANIENISLAEAGKIARKSCYPPDDSLRNHLSAGSYGMVKREAARMGLPVEILDTQRPWFLAMTFTSFEMMRSGFDPRYGIDRHFLSEAGGRKKIVELESLDSQVNLLSNLSQSKQKLLLLYTLKDLRRLGSEADKMVKAWKAGDGDEMASLLSKDIREDKKLASFYKGLLYDRNRNMSAKIEQFLRTDKTYFVVVGAGHVVGKKGIVEILKEKGYRVKQL